MPWCRDSGAPLPVHQSATCPGSVAGLVVVWVRRETGARKIWVGRCELAGTWVAVVLPLVACLVLLWVLRAGWRRRVWYLCSCLLEVPQCRGYLVFVVVEGGGRVGVLLGGGLAGMRCCVWAGNGAVDAWLVGWGGSWRGLSVW